MPQLSPRPHSNFACSIELRERGYSWFASALHPAFLSAAFVCAIVFTLVLFFVKEVPLRRGFEEPAAVADELGEGAVASKP